MGRDPLSGQSAFEPALRGVAPVPATIRVPYRYSLR
jgi:hypothetical protein